MFFVDFKVKEKELKLRLTASAVVQIEKRLGKSPVSVLTVAANEEMPRLDEILTILWGALQPLEKGYTLEKVYALYDSYVDEGKNIMDLIPVLIEVFQTAGLIPKDDEQEISDIEEKNV